jgi:GntR family uxuAB operon transcriptional repressor
MEDDAVENPTPFPTRSRRRYVEVAHRLLNAFAQNEFAVADRLPTDHELAARFGVSRPVVREALLVLELIGVVEIRHGDGVYLLGSPMRIGGTEGSALDVPPRELIESRTVLEPSVSRMAAERMSDDDIARVRADLDAMQSIAHDLRRMPDFVTLGLRFHTDIARACGNSLLADLVGQLVDTEHHPLWMLINQHAMAPVENRQSQIDEHRALLDAIARRDPDAAAHAMRAHLSGLEAMIFRTPADASARTS